MIPRATTSQSRGLHYTGRYALTVGGRNFARLAMTTLVSVCLSQKKLNGLSTYFLFRCHRIGRRQLGEREKVMIPSARELERATIARRPFPYRKSEREMLAAAILH